MIDAGEYSATIGNYGIKATKAGDPAPTIAFKAIDSKGAFHTVYWQGSFKEGTAREIALKALIVCGLKDAAMIQHLGKGPQGRALDMNKKVTVTVIHEERVDGKGMVPRVQWINEPGGAGFRNMMTAEDAARSMESLGLEADFLQIAQGAGLAPRAAAAPARPTPTADDIPF